MQSVISQDFTLKENTSDQISCRLVVAISAGEIQLLSRKRSRLSRDGACMARLVRGYIVLVRGWVDADVDRRRGSTVTRMDMRGRDMLVFEETWWRKLR